MEEVKPKRFIANMEPTEGIKVICDCCEFIKRTWDNEKEEYKNKSTDSYDIELDLSDCTQDKLHSDIKIIFPDGSKIGIDSSSNVLSYYYEASNGSTVYQELTPPKYCKKCGKETDA